jgi:hypothetical protein
MLDFLLDHRGAIAESIAIAVVLALGYCLLPQTSRWLYTVERGLGWLAHRRGLSILLVGLLAFGVSATLSLLGPMPEPGVHDEFSYLLAADTFARSRLSNPTHPMWVHFESFHIIYQPTYASKYPPAQGLMLAVGQVIGGHPIVGVWMGTGLACAAIYWMLLVWLPAWWALLGALLAALHPGMLLQWGQSYWGGTVAATGGALVFGALRRLMRRPRMRDALLMGVGLAVLANSRPYEGLIMSLPVASALLAWMLGKHGPASQVSLKCIVMPILGVLALTGGAMGFYNWRITGEALRMPYEVHERMYAVAPLFIWQHMRPEPPYRHQVMRDFHTDWAVEEYLKKRARPIDGVRRLRSFFLERGFPSLPFVLTVPLIVLPWMLREWWSRFALLTCGVLLLGLLMESWIFAHYAAPVTGLVFALMLQSMRHLRLWRRRGRPTGQLLVWAILVITVASFAVAIMQQMRVQPSGWQFKRAHILRQLTQDGGHHLVIVRYGSQHSPGAEWVYNEADIDSAPVVWAREMDMAQTRKLLEYFKDRHVWLAEVDNDTMAPTLVPYPRESRP